MARTKAEVRAFLDSLVGQSVNDKCGEYKGQCVSEIKAILEFLGVPNPYAARGNAKDVGNTLVNQGIAVNGDGWLRVCINPTMGLIGGVYYGHIWLDLRDEANYEQNGKTALRVTKNTRPISQAQQIVNLDKWITDSGGGSDMITENDVAPVRVVMSEVEGWNGGEIHSGSKDSEIMAAWVGHSWVEFVMHGWNVQSVHRQALVDSNAALTQTNSDLAAENKKLKEQIGTQDPDSVTVTKTSLWDWFKNLPFIKKG